MLSIQTRVPALLLPENSMGLDDGTNVEFVGRWGVLVLIWRPKSLNERASLFRRLGIDVTGAMVLLTWQFVGSC